MAGLQSLNIPKLSRRVLLAATAVAAMGTAKAVAQEAAPEKVDISSLPRVKQVMVAPPFLPEHEQVAMGGPKIVEVTFVIEEKGDRQRRYRSLGPDFQRLGSWPDDCRA
jgi:nitrite reductase (NO-forming)